MDYQINEIKTERVLSPTGIDLADYTVNPYRGCTFGCHYCYVRFNKFARRSTLPYGKYVDVKINFLDLFHEQIKKIRPKKILIGAVTDPYQPVEKKYKFTRKILELCIEYDINIMLLTKSDLILEDIDLLKKIKQVTISMTINDPFIIKHLENHTPDLNTRIDVIGELNQNNIFTYAHVGPYFPKITHYQTFFEKLLQKTSRINFESLNFRMISDWDYFESVLEKYEKGLTSLYQKLKTDELFYQSYWNQLKNDIEKQNQIYNFKSTLLFREFDRYYKNDRGKN